MPNFSSLETHYEAAARTGLQVSESVSSSDKRHTKDSNSASPCLNPQSGSFIFNEGNTVLHKNTKQTNRL